MKKMILSLGVVCIILLSYSLTLQAQCPSTFLVLKNDNTYKYQNGIVTLLSATKHSLVEGPLRYESNPTNGTVLTCPSGWTITVTGGKCYKFEDGTCGGHIVCENGFRFGCWLHEPCEALEAYLN